MSRNNEVALNDFDLARGLYVDSLCYDVPERYESLGPLFRKKGPRLEDYEISVRRMVAALAYSLRDIEAPIGPF